MINAEQLEYLVRIVGENLEHKDLEKRNEAIEAFYHVFGTMHRRELVIMVTPYVPKLLEILRIETDESISKLIALTLNNVKQLPTEFSDLLLLYKLGIEEYGISSSAMKSMLEKEAFTYEELKAAILELLQSPEKYKKLLATATIRTMGGKPSYIKIEQVRKDWLQILRNLIFESKFEVVRMVALKSLSEIVEDVNLEVKTLRKEMAYDVVFNLVSGFQPNIQVPLNRIIELVSPTINEQTSFFKQNVRITPPEWDFTIEMYEEILRDIVANGDVPGEYFALEQVFVRKNGKEIVSLTSSSITKKYVCYHCGSSIERDDKTCKTCKKEILRCTICKQPISLGEEVAECKHCTTKSHFTHIHEWVKIKGTCPTCQKKLVQEDLVSENI